VGTAIGRRSDERKRGGPAGGGRRAAEEFDLVAFADYIERLRHETNRRTINLE
jgi:hypothetical protein